MKIAIVSPYSKNPNIFNGGVEAVAFCLVSGLIELGGNDIHIIAPSNNADFVDEVRGNVNIHWIPKMRLPGVLGYWTEQRWYIQEVIKKLRPDIVHFQGIFGWSIGCKAPYVVTVHGIAEKDILYTTRSKLLAKIKSYVVQKIENFARKRTADSIFISPYIKTELKGIFNGRTHDIENPITGDFFTRNRLGSIDKRILYVGRLNQRKDIIGLLNVFAIIQQALPDAQLRIGGTFDSEIYKSSCLDFIATHNLQDNVTFLGAIDRDAIKDELTQASCLALLSRQETAPMIIEEAMAIGVPVVASNICGIPWMVDEGKTGYLIEIDDNQLAAKRIIHLLENEILNKLMGNAAKEVAISRFHYLAVAEKTLSIYQKVVDGF